MAGWWYQCFVVCVCVRVCAPRSLVFEPGRGITRQTLQAACIFNSGVVYSSCCKKSKSLCNAESLSNNCAQFRSMHKGNSTQWKPVNSFPTPPTGKGVYIRALSIIPHQDDFLAGWTTCVRRWRPQPVPYTGRSWTVTAKCRLCLRYLVIFFHLFSSRHTGEFAVFAKEECSYNAWCPTVEAPGSGGWESQGHRYCTVELDLHYICMSPFHTSLGREWRRSLFFHCGQEFISAVTLEKLPFSPLL